MGDWIHENLGKVTLATVVIFGGLIWWGVVEMNDWEDRCIDRGGRVESQFIGFITVQSGNTTTLVPNYSYHCMVGGKEIAV